MKRLLHIQIFILIFISFSPSVFSQNYAPLYGKDIVINDVSEENHKLVKICSASNGWLYSVYTFRNENFGWDEYVISRSIDEGITWDTLSYNYLPFVDFNIFTIEIHITGTVPSEFKIFLGMTYAINSSLVGESIIYQFDSEGHYVDYMNWITNTYYTSFIFASDDTIGVLAAVNYYTVYPDYLYFYYSVDGGQTFNSTVVDTTNDFLHKVDLSFGKGSSHPEGEFFAVWEIQDGLEDTPGKIFTAHTTNGISSAFSDPVRLDNIDPEASEKCSNPSLACHTLLSDNDSSDISEIIVLQNENLNNSSILTIENSKAVSGNNFRITESTDVALDCQQPDVIFNQYDSFFYLTYFDNTDKKLPLYGKNYLFTSGNVWDNISEGYNDSQDLSQPGPSMSISKTEHKLLNVWIGKNQLENGVALFDAEYSIYTGLENHLSDNKVLVYPNPCRRVINILQQDLTISKIEMFNLIGDNIDINYNIFCPTETKIDVSTLPSGIYFLKIYTGSNNVNIVKIIKD